MSPVPPSTTESQVSVAGDANRIKTHSSASVAELREFLHKMQGRSPQEVLGMVAASHLIRACIQATVWCLVLLAAFTVGPYYYELAYPTAKPVVAQQPTAPAPATVTPASNAESGDATKANNATDPKKPDLEQAAKKMGMDETKAADPKKNPLDNLDKLLDKLE